MYSTTDVTGYGESILKRFLELSNRISIYSLPMKPFIRFGKGMDDIYLSDISKNKHIFWDFDDVLQKMLLGIFKAIATPEQVAHLCVESWKVILKDFADKKQKQLNELIESKQPFQCKYTARDEFICKEVQAGSRFLYVGCGSGSDCLRFAHRGYKVVGIDTNSKLINIAQQWADYLALPFQPLCMDVMELGFDQESFDSFLTMYGQQPSLYQSLVLQRNLSRILRKGGRGFVIANRKKYSSYMALMSSRYPTAMNSWLGNQILLDYRGSQAEDSEEQLRYGLYWKTHTIDSLAAELSNTFNVVECLNDNDPRYVMCVVEKNEKKDSLELTDVPSTWEEPEEKYSKLDRSSIERILSRIESICDFLEAHERNVIHFFEGEFLRGKSPFQSLQLELSEFVRLLDGAFEEVSLIDITVSQPQ